MDFSSNRRHRSFKQWFDLLLHFHNEHGHCNVQRHQFGYRKLAGWVHRMRKKNKDGALHSSEIESLDSIGFLWSHISSPLPLDDGIAFLQEFKRRHGNCNVPYTYRPNQRFATWAHNQRAQFARKLRHQPSTMTKERLEKLTAVGLFDFRSRDALISLINIPNNDPYKPPPILNPSNFGTYQSTAIPNSATFHSLFSKHTPHVSHLFYLFPIHYHPAVFSSPNTPPSGPRISVQSTPITTDNKTQRKITPFLSNKKCITGTSIPKVVTDFNVTDSLPGNDPIHIDVDDSQSLLVVDTDSVVDPNHGM